MTELNSAAKRESKAFVCNKYAFVSGWSFYTPDQWININSGTAGFNLIQFSSSMLERLLLGIRGVSLQHGLFLPSPVCAYCLYGIYGFPLYNHVLFHDSLLDLPSYQNKYLPEPLQRSSPTPVYTLYSDQTELFVVIHFDKFPKIPVIINFYWSIKKIKKGQ